MALFLFGVLIVAITVSVAVAGVLVARRFFKPEILAEHNQVADPMLQVIGTLYAVLLGLLVVQSMEAFQKARLTVEAEAVAVADTFRLATALPDDLRNRLQRNCLRYVRAVVNEEWDDMQQEDTCDKAWEAIDEMWWDVISYTPRSTREQFVYPQLLEAAKSMNDHRRTRLVTCRTWVSPILWVVLVTGAVTTIVFTYCFGIKNVRAQVFMTSLIGVPLSLNIYLWAIYSNPFYGLLRVAPEAFEMDVEHFEFYLAHPDEQRWNRAQPKRKPTLEKREGKPDKSVDPEGASPRDNIESGAKDNQSVPKESDRQESSETGSTPHAEKSRTNKQEQADQQVEKINRATPLPEPLTDPD